MSRLATGLIAAVFFACGQPKKCNCPNDKNELPQPVQVTPTEVDVIYGQSVSRTDSFYTEKGRIFDRGREIKLKGINWFGLETSLGGLHGLWSGRSIESFVEQIKGLGFNAIRVPLAPEALSNQPPGRDGYESSRAQLDALLEISERSGVYVLLDLHNCSKYNSHLNKPGPAIGECSGYTVDKFLGDMRELAKIANSHKNVVGIDIFNEPYGYGWDAWASLAEKAGEAILKTNPRTLVFVEGVADRSPWGGYHPFWGENLYEADTKPARVPFSRLVYSPHVYGPSVAGQTYFNAPNFPQNMPAIWQEKWAKHVGKYPIVIGELGGRYVGQDKVWADKLIEFMVERKIGDFFYWCLNPNSGDTGGILDDDWRTVNQEKMRLLKPLLD